MCITVWKFTKICMVITLFNSLANTFVYILYVDLPIDFVSLVTRKSSRGDYGIVRVEKHGAF